MKMILLWYLAMFYLTYEFCFGMTDRKYRKMARENVKEMKKQQEFIRSAYHEITKP